MPYDFYIPSLNLCIEYQGLQHYELNEGFWGGKEALEKSKIRDKIKKEYCLSKKINFLEIKFNDDIEEILLNEVNVSK